MKEKEKHNNNYIAREPEISYQTNDIRTAQAVIPEYVWSDFRIGLEQYKRGEYISANDLLVNIKNGV